LVGAPIAIVEDEPGTTRDRLFGDVEWSGREFTLVDTGGIELEASTGISRLVREQAELAISQADLVLFCVDTKDGLTSDDHAIATVLRSQNKPVVIAAGKADNEERRLAATEFYELGFEDVITVSPLHGTGTGDLLDLIQQHLSNLPPEEPEIDLFSIAIVGRPNVGKSSLLNSMAGDERVIVSDIPGTTRDAIDTIIRHRDEDIVLVDTAGIRRRGRIERGVEKYSVMRALRAVNRADVVLILLDAVEGATAQDTHLAGYVRQAGRGIVLVVNKWDLIEKGPKTMDEYRAKLQHTFNFMPWAPVVFISAKTGQRVNTILDAVLEVRDERNRRISTGELNEFVRDATLAHRPPSDHGRALKVYYVTQAEKAPPTFVFFVNDPKLVHFSYERYLENRIREKFSFAGTPIRLVFRGRGESND
jgi:GTPase